MKRNDIEKYETDRVLRLWFAYVDTGKVNQLVAMHSAASDAADMFIRCGYLETGLPMDRVAMYSAFYSDSAMLQSAISELISLEASDDVNPYRDARAMAKQDVMP